MDLFQRAQGVLEDVVQDLFGLLWESLLDCEGQLFVDVLSCFYKVRFIELRIWCGA